jgi:hypothetical protein
MKTRKTTVVALLSQTLTTTSTFSNTSRSYAASADHEGERREAKTVTVTAPPANSVQRWCDECATPIAMIAPDLAATLCFQTTRAIYRLVEAGRVHFTDGPEGVMVCPASLMKDWAAEHSMPLLISAPVTQLRSESGPNDCVELQTQS